jgi:hypothetical protein
MRIRIQHFWSIRIQIQGFDAQKLDSKTGHFLNFVSHFSLLDLDPDEQNECGCGSMRIRIYNTGCAVQYLLGVRIGYRTCTVQESIWIRLVPNTNLNPILEWLFKYRYRHQFDVNHSSSENGFAQGRNKEMAVRCLKDILTKVRKINMLIV